MAFYIFEQLVYQFPIGILAHFPKYTPQHPQLYLLSRMNITKAQRGQRRRRQREANEKNKITQTKPPRQRANTKHDPIVILSDDENEIEILNHFDQNEETNQKFST
jgi:hypothetical protein